MAPAGVKNPKAGLFGRLELHAEGAPWRKGLGMKIDLCKL